MNSGALIRFSVSGTLARYTTGQSPVPVAGIDRLQAQLNRRRFPLFYQQVAGGAFATLVAVELGARHVHIGATTLLELMVDQRTWHAERALEWNAYAAKKGRPVDDPGVIGDGVDPAASKNRQDATVLRSELGVSKRTRCGKRRMAVSLTEGARR